jgi:hypothetical protein
MPRESLLLATTEAREIDQELRILPVIAAGAIAPSRTEFRQVKMPQSTRVVLMNRLRSLGEFGWLACDGNHCFDPAALLSRETC